MNISASISTEETLAELFRLLSQPARLQILLVIGKGEACVCHLEAALGLRQAYISQQLTVLRDAGLVQPIRDGRNIYYRLSSPQILDLVARAATLLEKPDPGQAFPVGEPVPNCPCPHCAEKSGAGAEIAKEINCC